jgi:cobalt-zinc-cadmium efflux system membrane fusion protein
VGALQVPANLKTDATFRPTATQWASLSLARADTRDFAQAVVSDGTVAVDDELTTPVLSPYTGRIVRVFVSAGARVRQGAPLFTIAGSELVQVHADLTSALATRTATTLAYNTAAINAARQARLLSGGAAAARDAQQAQVDLANARSALASAEANLGAVRGRLTILGAPGDGGGPNGEATVRAPIAGTVITRAVAQGQLVQSAATGATAPLLTLSDLGRVWLSANLREADAPLVHPGDRIEARVAGLGARVFRGRIDTVGVTVDPATRRVTARATVDNAGGLLRPGMFAQMRLAGAATQEHPAIPEDAVIYEGETAHVWVAHDDHSLEVRQISAGRSENGRVEVLAGLKPGEQVVTSGAVFIDRAARPE